MTKDHLQQVIFGYEPVIVPGVVLAVYKYGLQEVSAQLYIGIRTAAGGRCVSSVDGPFSLLAACEEVSVVLRCVS